MNYNTDTELYNILETKGLIVFGVGNYFEQFCRQYPDFVDKIIFCIDNKYQGKLNLALGKSICVYRPQYIKNKFNVSEHVLLFCSSYVSEMKQEVDEYLSIEYDYFEYPFYVTLPDKKIYKRIIAPLLMWENEQQILESVNCDTWEYFLRKYENNDISIIPRLAIVLTTKCSLRCKDCNELIGYYSHPTDLSKEKIINSLEKLMDIIDIIPCCELIGGEPFLTPILDDILSFLIGQDKVTRIEITTNGTVINKNLNIDNLKNPKVVIRISDYGNEVNQEKFIEFVKNNNVNMEVLKDMMWVVSGGPEKRDRDTIELIRQYDRCYGGHICKCLWEDKLFGCVRAASLEALGYTKGNQCIDIKESANLKMEVNNFLSVPYYEACDHCNIGLSDLEYIQPAIQL